MESNVQKMREALVSISSIDTRSLNRLLYELVENDIPDGGLINKITANVNKAKAALSDPPRNCDMYGGDFKMLHTAWFDWTGSPSGQNPDGTAKMGFGEWLLALAGKRGAV